MTLQSISPPLTIKLIEKRIDRFTECYNKLDELHSNLKSYSHLLIVEPDLSVHHKQYETICKLANRVSQVNDRTLDKSLKDVETIKNRFRDLLEKTCGLVDSSKPPPSEQKLIKKRLSIEIPSPARYLSRVDGIASCPIPNESPSSLKNLRSWSFNNIQESTPQSYNAMPTPSSGTGSTGSEIIYSWMGYFASSLMTDFPRDASFSMLTSPRPTTSTGES